MVGKMWSEIPRIQSQFMDNDHFRTCLQVRLGQVQVPPGVTCQISRKADGDERCMHELAEPCMHPHLCKMGPARMRPHMAVAAVVKKTLCRAGAEADLERAVSSLYRTDSRGRVLEAILDVVVIPPGCLSYLPIDVTIRCPHSDRYSGSANKVAVAAADGEGEKLSRYGPTVMPISLETYGRMGPSSIAGVRQLAGVLSTSAGFVNFRTGSDLLAALRGEIERTLLWNIADITLLSLGGASRVRAPRRQRASESRGSRG